MSIQESVAVRNARLDAIESTIGTSAIFAIMSGAQPANCGTAESGTRLVTATLPSDWLSNAASGVKAKSGTWQDTSADATGTAGYFRIYDSAGTTCHMQGSVTLTAGGGDVTLDNTSIVAGQSVTINTFSLTEANA